MIYLSLEQVISINQIILGETSGLRDLGLLESAIARPQTSAFGQDAYPSLHEKKGRAEDGRPR
jgi:death-on-curing protein